MKDETKKQPAVENEAVNLGWGAAYDKGTMNMVYTGNYKANGATFKGRIVVSERSVDGRIARTIEKFIFAPPHSWLQLAELDLPYKDHMGTLKVSPMQRGEWYQIEYRNFTLNYFDATPTVIDAISSIEKDLKIMTTIQEKEPA